MKKKILITSIITAVAFFFAIAIPVTGGSRHPISACFMMRINMTGPSSVSSSGGPYTYTVNLTPYGGVIPPGAEWQIIKSGSQTPVWTGVASGISGGSTSKVIYGYYFGGTGVYTVYLTDGATIFGSRGVTVS